MKKTISILLAVLLISALVVTVFAVDAQIGVIGIMGRHEQKLTDAERAALEAKKTELLAKYNALPDDQKALVKEMVNTLTPMDLMTDVEKAAKKAEMEKKRSERATALEKKYQTLTAEQKAIVDEIKAIFSVPKDDMTDAQMQALKEKRDALMKKIAALSDADKEALRDFLPMMGKGMMGKGMRGRAPMGMEQGMPKGTQQTAPEAAPNA